MNRAGRFLHSANILVSTVGAVTADTLLPGSSAVLGGSLSVTTLFGAGRPKTPDIDQRVSKLLREALDYPTIHLPQDAERLILQMIESGALTSAEVMAAARDPKKICDAMLAKLDRPEYQTYEIQQAFTAVIEPIFGNLLIDPEVCDHLRPAFEQALAGSLASIESQLRNVRDTQDHHNAMLVALLERSSETGRELNLKEGLVIALARRYAPDNPDDFDSALAGIEHALETAAEGRRKGQLLGKVPDAVNAAIARVDAMNDAGRIDDAATELWEEIERHEAAQVQLLDKGISQAVLTRDVALAVRLELKKLALLGASFKRLEQVTNAWFLRGRDQGLNFDLEVAISLMQGWVKQASTPEQRGSTLNNLGIALHTLGVRMRGTARIEEAVATFQAALLEWTRDRFPTDWASTQCNLGAGLRALGERENSLERLEQAVEAFKNALLEQTPEGLLKDWVATQINLGNTLFCIGVREKGTDRLEDAVEVFEQIFLTQVYDEFPMKWARAKMNLGTTLCSLGERKCGTKRLYKALNALEDSQTVFTRDRVPLDWAGIQLSFSNVHLGIFDKTGEVARLDTAQAHLDQAREVFAEAQASHYLEMAAQQQVKIDKRRGAVG